jgi:UDP-glucose 4-epimerase
VTRVVVTGAGGFVGRFVVAALRAHGASVLALTQRAALAVSDADAVASASHLTSEEQLASLLHGASAVVHLAARVHDVHGLTSAVEYAAVNRDYTLRLARAAARAGVERFVFLSSIKVNGESTPPGAPFSEASLAAPQGAYAESKWQAEQGLYALSGPPSVVVVRSPLVYGPGVRANFARLLRAVARGVPLPFGAIRNQRSLVYVENLADALALLAMSGAAPSSARTYLIADGEDVSTPELIRRLAAGLRVRPRLIAVPSPLLALALSALRRSASVPRLLGSLCVDAGRLRRELNWLPPYSLEQGLARTAAWFLEEA